MKSARWNFEASDTHILVCKNHHEPGAPCEYERMHPAEVLELLDEYRARVLELERLAAPMVPNAEIQARP